MKQMLANISNGLPGIDEANSFAQMIKLVESDFDVVVFDTAPTGHTLRLLHFPTMIEKSLGQLFQLKSTVMPMFSQMAPMFGMNNITSQQAESKMEETLRTVREINAQFKNPELTTFVCVCIAEFLSMYETERLIQELVKKEIDTHNIIVNQLVFPECDEFGGAKCKQCNARYKIQQKYLKQINELYGEDFHITKLPLVEQEVRGPKQIEEFSANLLMNPSHVEI